MTGRERVKRALIFQQPDRPPRELWALPGVLDTRPAEYQALLARYPSDFLTVGPGYAPSHRARGAPGTGTPYTDEWGSVWEAGEPGVIGEVKHPALSDWTSLASFVPPWEMLDGASLDAAKRACESSSQFCKAGGMIRPFERLQFLRGTENLFLDLAWGCAEIERLIAMVHEFHLRDLELLVAIGADAVMFMDDWGTQQALLISPDMWRQVFKPLYRAYCERIHAAGQFVFFHSDGHIASIYPDLIEIGVHAINSQLFCMDIEQLGAQFAGKITFWGEIDRQHLLPRGTPAQVRNAVYRVRRALDTGRGGVIAQCEWGLRDPRENIEAVFDAWNEPHPDPTRRYPLERSAAQVAS